MDAILSQKSGECVCLLRYSFTTEQHLDHFDCFDVTLTIV